MGMLHDGALKSLRGVKRLALRNPHIRAALYEVRNRAMFHNVYEHDKMIADRVRMDTYHAAISRHVHQGDVVVDVGTGTGILAFFASQKRPEKIYAIDHGDILKLAERLAYANGIDGIRFIGTHSKQFSSDVILHEQIGEKLFDERMIENICDVRDRLLKPGGRILPAKFELFIEPYSLHDERVVPFLWENRDVHGISYACLESEFENGRATDGQGSGYLWRILAHNSGQFLCEPASAYKLDLMTVEPDRLPRHITLEKTAIRTGRMDGFCVYFRVIFDEDLDFDTSPLSPVTHWLPYLYRCAAFEVEKGDNLVIDWLIDDLADPASWTLSARHGGAA